MSTTRPSGARSGEHTHAKTLLELGRGFAFLGQQFHFEVGGDDFYIDLLFYNVVAHRYFVVELKAGTFKPEFTGKLNFYVSWVDRNLRGDRDDATVGLLLCAGRNNDVVDLATLGQYFGDPVREPTPTSSAPGSRR